MANKNKKSKIPLIICIVVSVVALVFASAAVFIIFLGKNDSVSVDNSNEKVSYYSTIESQELKVNDYVRQAIDEAENTNSLYNLDDACKKRVESATDNFSAPDSNKKLVSYNYLNEDQQKLYQILSDSLNDFDALAIKSGELESITTIDDFIDSFAVVDDAFCADHPSIYWYAGTISFNLLNDEYYVANLCYLFSDKESGFTDSEFESFVNQKEQFDSNLESIINESVKDAKSDSPWDKAWAIYHWICTNITYNKEIAGVTDSEVRSNLSKYKEVALGGSIYSAVMNKSCVCRGYSELYSYLLNYYGIECVGVAGYLDDNFSNEVKSLETVDEKYTNHVWNIVYVNDNYYYSDATNTSSSTALMITDFLMNDTAIASSYKICDEFPYPSCKSTTDTFLRHEGLYDTLVSNEDVDNALKYAVDNDLDAIGIQYSTLSVAQKAYDDLYENSNVIQDKLVYFDIMYDDKFDIDDTGMLSVYLMENKNTLIIKLITDNE